jgi:hypothetical protein
MRMGVGEILEKCIIHFSPSHVRVGVEEILEKCIIHPHPHMSYAQPLRALHPLQISRGSIAR